MATSAAPDALERGLARYSQSKLLRIQLIRINMLEFAGAHRIVLGREDPRGRGLPGPGEKRRTTARARETKIGQRPRHYVRAGIAACEENAVRAVEELTAGADLYESAEMSLRAQMLRYRLGEILSDPPTRRLAKKRSNGSGPGNRLARPVVRHVRAGVRQNLRRIDRNHLLSGDTLSTAAKPGTRSRSEVIPFPRGAAPGCRRRISALIGNLALLEFVGFLT